MSNKFSSLLREPADIGGILAEQMGFEPGVKD